MSAPFEVPVAERVSGSIRVPGSKSVTLRSLFVAGLARGESILRNPLASSDVDRMAGGLRQLGAEVRIGEAGARIDVRGMDGRPRSGPIEIDAGDCGTCMRFLLAGAALGEGPRLLDGTPRMRQRPVGGLADALSHLGVTVEYPERAGYPPARLHAATLRGGEVPVDAGASSQFVSALLLVAPYASRPVLVRPTGPVPSRPYIDLTEEVMVAFGASLARTGDGGWRVESGHPYEGREIEIEGDWSSASYFLAAAAICRGEIEIAGVRRTSRQGDAVFVSFLESLGCRAYDTEAGVRLDGAPLQGDLRIDLRDAPDIVPTAAVVAAFNRGRVEIVGVPHLRIKESDRIRTVAEGLGRIGATVEEREDGLVVEGGGKLRGATIDPHDDHRIAMCFAVAGLRASGVRILDPGCVAKSFPAFFEELRRIVRSPV